MKKTASLSLLFALAFGVASLPGVVSAAETASSPGAYAVFAEKAAGIQQQLYAKRLELGALYQSEQRDDAKAQQLYEEIAALQAQLYAARAELRDVVGDDDGWSGRGPGMHHGGAPWAGGRGYMGGGGHRGGMMHGGYRGHGGYGYGCGQGW